MVVGLVAIVVGAWAAFRSARPRRALYINVDQAVSLLRAAPGLHGSGVVVSFNGRTLTRPYVVTIDVVSDSALDIAPSAFGGKPLELEFGVPVLALFEHESHPGRPAVRMPKVNVVGTALHISPALLTRRHRLRYTVLLDGKPNFRPIGELVDVAVHVGGAPVRLPLIQRLGIAGLLMPIITLIGLSALVPETPNLVLIGAGILVLLGTIGVLSGLGVFRTLRSR
ncbi:hypothetical protein [Lentzea sp. NPDC060358]|uniref:hypothetical protein n=1 Tax=Lentzea sp. NPDC060358 TaxID=3347103 RepID=UPI00364E16CB